MWIRLVGRQNLASTARIRNSGTEEGTGIGHDVVYSGWYGDWFSINFMTGLVSVDSEAWVWVVRVERVDGWCVCIVDVTSVESWVEALLVLQGMIFNHVSIIVVLAWNVRSSSLVLVVGLISGWEWWSSWGIGVGGIWRVKIAHSIMLIGVWSIGRALRILIVGAIGRVWWLWILGRGRRYIVVLMILVTRGCSGRW